LAKAVIVNIHGALDMALLPASLHIVLSQLRSAASAKNVATASEEEFKSGFQTARLGTFNIVLTVDPPLVPLALAAIEDIGPAGVALPAGKVLPITGGKPPYSLTNVTGQVPTGISIMPDGTLTGTPTALGDYSLTIDLKDANG
jgi:hypothetical protein